MIQDVEIVINLESIAKSKYNSITGEIFFKVGEKFFPHENWNDFIVVILSWWINAFKNFYELRETCFEMAFMDGPLSVKCKRDTDEVLKLYFVKQYADEEDVIFSINCSDNSLRKNLVEASRKVLKEIENRNWENSNIAALKKLVDQFQ